MRTHTLVCLLCGGWLSFATHSLAQNRSSPQPIPLANPKLARDTDGFPLPTGAVTRFGDLRWRTTEYVTSLAFSPDGKRLVSTDRHSVRVWEVASGKELAAVAEPYVDRAIFNHDGSRFLQFAGQSVVLRHGHDAKELGEYMVHGILMAVVPHPKKDEFAMITRNGKVYVARSDVFVKDSLIVIADMPERNLDAARWSHDGKTLGVTDASGNLWLMDPAAKKVRPAANGQPLDQGRSVGKFLFTPDDKAIVFFRAGALSMCDIATGKVVRQFDPAPRRGSAWWLSQDGRQLMIGDNGPERIVYRWDTQTGDLTQKYKYVNKTTARYNLGFAFSPDGTLAASSDGHRISVWDIRTGKPLSMLAGHYLPIEVISFLTDGRQIGTIAKDGQTFVWDSATGKLLRSFAINDHSEYSRFVKNGTAIIARAVDGIRIWDVQSGMVASNVRPSPGLPRGADFASTLRDVARSGKTLLLGTSGGVHHWDVETSQSRHHFQVSNPVGHLSLSPDERRLVEWWDHSLALWDIPTGKRLWQLREEKGVQVNFLAFTVDSRRVLIENTRRPDGDRFVFLDVATGNPHGHLKSYDNGLQCVVFTSDGRWMATASKRGEVRLWETATLLPLARILPYRPFFDGQFGKTYEKVKLAFGPDGLRLAMGVDDGSGLVYSLPRLFGNDNAPLDDKAWDTLAAGNGKAVLDLMMTLAKRPKDATAWLKGKLHKAQGVPDKTIHELIASLDAADFAKRVAANAELIKLGDVAEEALRAALLTNKGLETNRRIEAILELLDLGDRQFPSSSMRIARAIQVMQIIDSPVADKILADLSQGDPRARQTRHARAALERRNLRP